METKEVNADRELLKALARYDVFTPDFMYWIETVKCVNLATLDELSDDKKREIAYALNLQI